MARGAGMLGLRLTDRTGEGASAEPGLWKGQACPGLGAAGPGAEGALAVEGAAACGTGQSLVYKVSVGAWP